MRLIFILLVIFSIGCGVQADSTNPDEPRGSNGNRYEIVTIDSCEYVEYDSGFGDARIYGITHKGNCKYCAQRIKNQQNKEQMK